MRKALIVDSIRTARGKRKNGGLNGVHAQELAARTLDGLVKRTGVDPALVEDVILGCVTQVGEQAFNVARGAVLAAGWPLEVPAATLNRLCGSGQTAIHFAAQSILAGLADCAVGGGVESMSRMPMGSDMAGGDGPFSPMLSARFDLVPQGESAERVAAKYGVTREDCDLFAYESQQRAAAAIARGAFQDEILPLEVRGPDGQMRRFDTDEHVRGDTTIERLASLQPAFRAPGDGVVTAASSSGIVDGASATLVASAEFCERHGLRPRARILSMAHVGCDPVLMLEGPIPATRKALQRAGLHIEDIGSFECNEAFAPVVLAWSKVVGADLAKTNVNGGAIALGHPLGATGGMLFATLLRVLEERKERYGIVTMCVGYGIGTATVIERIE